MQRLATLALALSAAFALQVPSAPALARSCHSNRTCPRGDYCRMWRVRQGVCVRRRHVTPPVDTPVATPPSHGPEIMCPMIYQPVCGADGKTYPNQCHATRAGAKVSHAGAC